MAKNPLLSNLPPGTTRVQVLDELGKTKYKAPQDILATDTICTTANGAPIVMKGSPGRAKRPELAPTNEKVAELIRAKELAMGEDDLLDAVKKNPEAGAVLDYVLVGLAEEAASLNFERHEAERTGSPTSQISVRRVNTLKAVGDSFLKRKELLSANSVDLESPAFKRVFRFITETIKDALTDSGVRPEMIETIFANFAKKLDDDWHKEATKRMTES